MSAVGVILKTALLLWLTILASVVAWRFFGDLSPRTAFWIFSGTALGLLTLLFGTLIQKKWAIATGPLFALGIGGLLGLTCARYQLNFEGQIVQIVMLGLLSAVLMTVLYLAGVLRPDSKLRAVVMTSTGAIFLAYLITFLLGRFGIFLPFVHEAGLLGILAGGFAAIAAPVCLVFDFDAIERMEAEGVPRWGGSFASFTILTTVIWFPIEVFVHLAKSVRRLAREIAARV